MSEAPGTLVPRSCAVSRVHAGPGAWFEVLSPVPPCRFAAIHAEAPEFVEMSVEQEILVTGIKVVDLLAPYAKGGKIGACSLWALGGDREIPSLMRNHLTFVLLSWLKPLY